MNWEQLEGNWAQVKGSVKNGWHKLTDDDLTAIGGRREQLIGKLAERYGLARDAAERELEEWQKIVKM